MENTNVNNAVNGTSVMGRATNAVKRFNASPTVKTLATNVVATVISTLILKGVSATADKTAEWWRLRKELKNIKSNEDLKDTQ